MPKRGRPSTGQADRKSLRVEKHIWEALAAIAERENLRWGADPAPGKAVVWLVEQDTGRFLVQQRKGLTAQS